MHLEWFCVCGACFPVAAFGAFWIMSRSLLFSACNHGVGLRPSRSTSAIASGDQSLDFSSRMSSGRGLAILRKHRRTSDITTKQVRSAIPAMGSMAESTKVVMTGGTAKQSRYGGTVIGTDGSTVGSRRDSEGIRTPSPVPDRHRWGAAESCPAGPDRPTRSLPAIMLAGQRCGKRSRPATSARVGVTHPAVRSRARPPGPRARSARRRASGSRPRAPPASALGSPERT
jgi:hypothetical protein